MASQVGKVGAKLPVSALAVAAATGGAMYHLGSPAALLSGLPLAGRESSSGVSKRFFSNVKFMDEKRSGEETVYFKKEDESLLRNLLANHPEFNPKYAWNQSKDSALAKDITLVCQKHGLKDPSAAFMQDLIDLFSNHGYVKSHSK